VIYNTPVVGRALLKGLDMSRFVILCFAWAFCVLLPARLSAGASSDSTTNMGETGVALTLTRFDVNDRSLNLTCRVVNNGKQEIWVCDNVTDGSSSKSYEVYLGDDCRTLTIRRRLEVAEQRLEVGAMPRFYQARYLRLPPGQDRIWSFMIAVPVKPCFILMGYPNKADYATRVSVEIGVYDGNLPGRIGDTIALAERLDTSYRNKVIAPDYELFDQYFSGFRISDAFGGSAGFRKRYEPGNDQITIDRSWPWPTVSLFGERPLQITIDGVSIPYKAPN
jgi:hypothetical protein